MRAAITTKYGPPEVLQIKEVDKPVPKDDEVLIKVHATTVTVADTRMRGFRVPSSFWIPARLALGITRPKNPILGVELAGEIESAGRDVMRFHSGDSIFASATAHIGGAYAEYICLPEDGVIAPKPSNLSFEEAAAVPVGGRTALYFLKQAHIWSGQKVLIYGASGSVGTYAVQLAKHYRAEVTGVCGTANLELVRSLGADRVIDYARENFASDSAIYDVVFDAVGKARLSDCMRSLKKEGMYLQAVATPGMSARMRWAGMINGKKAIGGHTSEGADSLDFLRELIERGEMKPVIDRTYPLERIAEAHAYVDKGHKRGNVVIVV